MRHLTVGLSVVVALLTAVPAASADTDVDFETPAVANCASVTNQFPGVTFVGSAPESIGSVPATAMLTLGAGAHSPTHALQTGGCGDEFPNSQAVMQLAQTRAGVSLFVRSPDDGFTAQVQLRAYDAGGVRIDGNGNTYQSLVGGTGPWTQISAATADATNRIATVALVNHDTVQGVHVYMDDLHLTDGLVAATPDFTLGPSPIVVVDQGATTSLSVPVNRLNGSSGGISATTSSLPALMVARATPDGMGFRVDVMAALETPPGPGQFTLTGTPTGPSSGPQPRSATVPVTVREVLPTITIADPADGTLLDRVPFDPVAHGTVTDPRDTARVCVVTSHTPEPVAVPATCAGQVRDGTWAVGLDDIQPGANYLTAFVRDGTGHVGRATRLVRVADTTTGVDLRITGVQLSQDVQGYRDFLYPLPGGVPSPYTGVPLVQGKPLSVRVFANTNRPARSEGTTPRVAARGRRPASPRTCGCSPAGASSRSARCCRSRSPRTSPRAASRTRRSPTCRTPTRATDSSCRRPSRRSGRSPSRRASTTRAASSNARRARRTRACARP